jgi:hypothetical protein
MFARDALTRTGFDNPNSILGTRSHFLLTNTFRSATWGVHCPGLKQPASEADFHLLVWPKLRMHTVLPLRPVVKVWQARGRS